MHSRFEFKLKKNKTTNLKLGKVSNDLKKITMKFVGLYSKSKVKFSSKVVIHLDSKNKNLIKSVTIEELDVKDSSDHHTGCEFNNVYTLYSSSSSSSSSCSSSSSNSSDDVYDEVMKFLKHIKLTTENNNLTGIIFSLADSKIMKIKVKGKLSF